MKQAIRTNIMRWAFNLFPAYLGTGARVVYLAPDWQQVTVKLPLSWRTRNPFGTLFGGSMYAAVDPVYVVMLTRLLGRSYIVWDKAASIRFKWPGRSALYAKFSLPDAEIALIKRELAVHTAINRVYNVTLTDKNGVIHATIEKTLYIATRGAVRNTSDVAAQPVTS